MIIQASFIEARLGQTGPHRRDRDLRRRGATKVVGNHIRMTDAKGEWLGGPAPSASRRIGATSTMSEMNQQHARRWLVHALRRRAERLESDEREDHEQTFYKATAAYGTHLIRREGFQTVFTGKPHDDGKAVEK